MKVLLLAGEESGVLYAKGIAERLRRARPDVEIRGFGDYGFETHDLAVMGFAAGLSRIFYFLRVKKTLERAIDAWRPDVVCTVDYPGMNLKLAAYAKARGIRTVHVVCPQVWAWKAGRIPKIEASLDCLCCFFPFEPKLFKPGFATFVGHPLAAEFGNRKASAARGRPLLAVLPGSRHGEIERLLPTLVEAVKGLDADVVIPAATDRAYAQINEMLRGISASVTVQKGGARELLQKADCGDAGGGAGSLPDRSGLSRRTASGMVCATCHQGYPARGAREHRLGEVCRRGGGGRGPHAGAPAGGFHGGERPGQAWALA